MHLACCICVKAPDQDMKIAQLLPIAAVVGNCRVQFLWSCWLHKRPMLVAAGCFNPGLESIRLPTLIIGQ